jgi:hypothetical protein
MPHYPQSATGLSTVNYEADPVSSGSVNTKGTWTQYVASTLAAYNRAEVIDYGSNSSGRRYLMDVGTGAAASEVVIVPDLLFDSATTAGQSGFARYVLPLSIAAGTRVAVRCASSVASSQPFTQLHLMAAGDTPAPTSYLNYGSDSSDSGGVNVDPGGTVLTKGAYSQLTASTSAVVQILCVMFAQNGNTAPSNANFFVDIATGAAAAEVVLIPDLLVATLVTQNPTPPRSYTRLTYIPASTRLAARALTGINDATDRLIDVAVVAATAPTEPSGVIASRIVTGF